MAFGLNLAAALQGATGGMSRVLELQLAERLRAEEDQRRFQQQIQLEAQRDAARRAELAAGREADTEEFSRLNPEKVRSAEAFNELLRNTAPAGDSVGPQLPEQVAVDRMSAIDRGLLGLPSSEEKLAAQLRASMEGLPAEQRLTANLAAGTLPPEVAGALAEERTAEAAAEAERAELDRRNIESQIENRGKPSVQIQVPRMASVGQAIDDVTRALNNLEMSPLDKIQAQALDPEGTQQRESEVERLRGELRKLLDMQADQVRAGVVQMGGEELSNPSLESAARGYASLVAELGVDTVLKQIAERQYADPADADRMRRRVQFLAGVGQFNPSVP